MCIMNGCDDFEDNLVMAVPLLQSKLYVYNVYVEHHLVSCTIDSFSALSLCLKKYLEVNIYIVLLCRTQWFFLEGLCESKFNLEQFQKKRQIE